MKVFKFVLPESSNWQLVSLGRPLSPPPLREFRGCDPNLNDPLICGYSISPFSQYLFFTFWPLFPEIFPRKRGAYLWILLRSLNKITPFLRLYSWKIIAFPEKAGTHDPLCILSWGTGVKWLCHDPEIKYFFNNFSPSLADHKSCRMVRTSDSQPEGRGFESRRYLKINSSG
jgi:hypothetical protein